MSGGVLRLIAQEVCHLSEEFHDRSANALVRDGNIGRFAHELHPAISLCDTDLEGHVASAQAGMSTFDEIVLIGTKPEEQEVPEPFLGPFPIVIGIHWADEIINFHPFVEFVSQAGKTVLTKSRID